MYKRNPRRKGKELEIEPVLLIFLDHGMYSLKKYAKILSQRTVTTVSTVLAFYERCMSKKVNKAKKSTNMHAELKQLVALEKQAHGSLKS